MTSISESLAISAQEQRTVRCTFRAGAKHSRTCVCQGTGMIMACAKCEGSGWDRIGQKYCSGCTGLGSHSAKAGVSA